MAGVFCTHSCRTGEKQENADRGVAGAAARSHIAGRNPEETLGRVPAIGLAITLYKEPEFWRQIGEHVRAQEWSEEACRYIGKRVEDIKYEFNSRDYTELWRVLDELERICLEEALKDPLRRTKITLRGFGLTILVFVLIGVFVRII